MPKVKHTSINPGSGDELGVSPNYPDRSNPNPQRPIEDIVSSRIKELPRRMSVEISFSSEKGGPLGRVDEKETDTDRNPGASVVSVIGKVEDSDESSSEESQSTKRAKISHRIN